MDIKNIDVDIKKAFGEIENHKYFIQKQAALMQTFTVEINTLYQAIIEMYRKKCHLLEAEIKVLQEKK